jgi:hypothetical protein
VGQASLITSGNDECGPPSTDDYPPGPPGDPACVALLACGSAVGDATNIGATCELVAASDHTLPCASALAYFRSMGLCGTLDYDAGMWTGLLPVADAGPSASGTASHGP